MRHSPGCALHVDGISRGFEPKTFSPNKQIGPAGVLYTGDPYYELYNQLLPLHSLPPVLPGVASSFSSSIVPRCPGQERYLMGFLADGADNPISGSLPRNHSQLSRRTVFLQNHRRATLIFATDMILNCWILDRSHMLRNEMENV